MIATSRRCEMICDTLRVQYTSLYRFMLRKHAFEGVSGQNVKLCSKPCALLAVLFLSSFKLHSLLLSLMVMDANSRSSAVAIWPLYSVNHSSLLVFAVGGLVCQSATGKNENADLFEASSPTKCRLRVPTLL